MEGVKDIKKSEGGRTGERKLKILQEKKVNVTVFFSFSPFLFFYVDFHIFFLVVFLPQNLSSRFISSFITFLALSS